MKKISRREFAKQTALIGAGLVTPNLFAGIGRTMSVNEVKVNIPMPIQIVIDDVGWWSGEDGSKRQEPYRTGINRNHVPADYQAIVDLGRKLNIRPQAATILSEWDRQNILKELPTSTWMGDKWDNGKWQGPWLDEAAEIIRNNKDHYEFTLHGIGHEYWDNENFTRAEWADRSGRMRSLDQVELHLDYFAKLMDQNQLGDFPTSFVPTAFLHGFGPTGDHKISMAGVLKKRGINYINTPFYNMYNAKAVQFGLFGIDEGVITVDRGSDLFRWNVCGGEPQGVLKGPTCGMHWPNLLHEDPDRNSETVDKWVTYLKPYNDKLETLLAKNSRVFRMQLIHHLTTRIRWNETAIELDFSEGNGLLKELERNELIIKISSPNKLTFHADDITISGVDKIIKEYHNLYTLRLNRFPDYDKAKININTI